MKYKIENISEKQLNVIMEALDLHSRLLCGQLSEIENFLRFNYNKHNLLNHTKIHDAIYDIKEEFFPELRLGASHSIRSQETPPKAQIGYDIIQVARHIRAWSKNPEGGFQVDYQTPWKCGQEEFVEITTEGKQDETLG